MEVVRCKTKEEARTKATDELNNLFLKISNPVLFLASGGSCLELLEGLYIGENGMVSVLDERYSTDPAVQNFAQLLERVHPITCIDTRVREHETLGQLAQRFEKELREWKEKNPNGNMVITQGMGQDGHTAGIMPQIVFDDEKKWVAGYDAKERNEYPLRVTCTFTFLRQVDYSIAYITGEKKKEALLRLLAEEGTLEETPARIMREMKNVKIFTDIVY